MKKIIFILLVLVSGTVFGQTANAIASADIVSPLTITKTQDMNFGKVSNATTGTVVLSTAGTTTGLSQVGATTTTTAAIFDVTAANGYSYKVSLPTGDITLTSGSNTMKINNFTADPDVKTTNPTGTGSTQTINVGATLNVTSGQATGNYTGSFDVSVAYE